LRFLRDAEATATTAKDLVRVTEQLGFLFRRQRGRHAIYVRQSDQARVVIPMHKGELKRKTLRAIIQDLEISVEEFASML
jgi:predicted RNA binding protein YcfA (HicA-like mRNA interferase family)